MAQKTTIVSDISGEELTDETHTTLVVRHPDLSFPVRLDVSADEAAKLTESTLRLVTFTIHVPNQAVRTATMETKVVDKLFPDFDKVLEGAPKAEVVAAKPATPAKKSAAPASRTDFTAPDNFGKLHRGRVTEAEAELVRANREQASANRGEPIDWNSDAEKKRYGLG